MMKKQKLEFKTGRVILTGVYLYFCIVFLWSRQYVAPQHRYWSQLLFIIGMGFLLLTLISLGKLFTREIRVELMRRIGVVFSGVGARLRRIAGKIREKLGIPERRKLHGQDEKSYIFDYEKTDLYKKLHPERLRLKWKEMSTHAEQIRYLYIKMLLGKIKKGASVSGSDTPLETSASLDLKNDDESLAHLYCGARYNQSGSFDVSDEVIERHLSHSKRV